MSIDGNFFLPNDSNNNFEFGYEEDEDEDDIPTNYILKKKDKRSKSIKQDVHKKPKSPPSYNNNAIKSIEEIADIVGRKEKYDESKVCLLYVTKVVEENNIKTNIKVINDDQFLLLLKFLYRELNQTLIEMFDGKKKII